MSCLFNSLSILLKDELQNNNIQNLRREICNYMQNNLDKDVEGTNIKDWLEFSTDLPASNYIENMRSNSKWGGGPEIAIVSKMFNLIINISYQNKIIAKFNCCKVPKKEITLNYTGNHYEPGNIVYIF